MGQRLFKKILNALMLTAWLFLFIFFIILAPWENISHPFLTRILHDFYAIDAGQCVYASWGKVNFLWLGYAAVLVFALACRLIQILFRHKILPGFLQFPQSLFTASVLVMTAIFLLQTRTHARQAVFEYKHFSGKTLEEKYHALKAETYAFAAYCRAWAPGAAAADLLTDQAGTTDGYYDAVDLKYFLYPINIIDKTQNPDALIFYKKNDVRSNVPSGFQLCPFYNHNSAIAIRASGR